MSKMIFVNLPVADLPQSMAFYEAVGFTNNPQFTNDRRRRWSWSDEIVVMLLTHDSSGRPSPTRRFPTRKRDRAGAAVHSARQPRGGRRDRRQGAAPPAARPSRRPTQDHGFMYGRSFEDPDGHIWETMCMDPRSPSRRARRTDHV